MVGAVVAQKVGEMIKEYKALNAEIDKLTAPRARADFQNLTELEGHLKSVSDALEKLRGQQDDLKGANGPGSSVVQYLKDWFLGSGYGGSAIEEKRKGQIGELAGSADRDRGDMALKFQHRIRDREAALGGEPDFISKAKQLQRVADEKKHDTQEAVMELTQELELSFRELAKTVAEKRRERVQRTLGEIAAIPEWPPPG
jgi:hypothetical protein